MTGFVEEWDALRRRSLDAAARLRRASRRLDAFRGRSEPTRVLVSIEARTLLASVLDSAEILAYCLDEVDEYELVELERAAADVRSVLRRRRLAVKLAATSGRTPEEATAFAAKAEEMTS